MLLWYIKIKRENFMKLILFLFFVVVGIFFISYVNVVMLKSEILFVDFDIFYGMKVLWIIDNKSYNN